MIIDRLSRLSEVGDEFYMWEARPSLDSESGSVVEVKIDGDDGRMGMDDDEEDMGEKSIDEVTKSEAMDFTESDEDTPQIVEDTELFQAGCKPDLFRIRIQSGHGKFGTGATWNASPVWIKPEKIGRAHV